MNKIVEVKRNEVHTDSLIYAEKFGINHRDLLEKIRKLTAELSAPEKYFQESKFINKQGREYTKYLLNKKGFSLLIMNTGAKGKEERRLLLEMQENFIDAFSKMEQELLKAKYNSNNLEWNKTREQGKEVRLELTDTVKEFVEYAVSQGSKNAKRYYSNITKMEYKALGLVQENSPKLRETLDTMELFQLIMAEDLVKRQIKKYMLENLHYKEIYLLVKTDLERYAGVLKMN